MADRSRDRTPDDDTTDEPTGPTPLTERWWWTGGALALVGVVVIGWQWDVIVKGEAIIGTWVVAALGAGAIALGATFLWRDRPKRSADTPPEDD